MNAVELRVGNYIYDKEMRWRTVYGINVFDEVCLGGDECLEYLRNCTPIPLTEDLFLECGFEKKRVRTEYERSDCFSKNGVNLYEIEGKFHLGFYYEDGDRRLQVSELSKEIKYLHQLQNIYFDITGEEL